MISFEDSIAIIDEEIHRKRGKWKLTSVQSMDFDDISQILRIHISKKWDMWDQSRPLRPWLHVIITNQIRNLVRNNYGNYARPCLHCSAAEENNLCKLYVTQCNDCPIYKNWFYTKKYAYDVKIPLALEFHSNEFHDIQEDNVDIESGIENLHFKMKEVLKPVEYKVYKYLYIEDGDESKIGKILGFKTNEKGRHAGYRQLKNIKDSILLKARKVIYDTED